MSTILPIKSSLHWWAFHSLPSTGCRVGERKCWCLTRRGWSFTLLTFHLKLEPFKKWIQPLWRQWNRNLGCLSMDKVQVTLNSIPLINRNNGESYGQWHLEKTISLRFQNLFVGSTERHLFLYHGGSTSLDAVVFHWMSIHSSLIGCALLRRASISRTHI